MKVSIERKESIVLTLSVSEAELLLSVLRNDVSKRAAGFATVQRMVRELGLRV